MRIFNEIVLRVILVICIFSLGFAVSNIIDSIEEESQIEKEILSSEECTDLDLEDTAYCLKNYISVFYNYKERSEEVRTLDDIKENGGDCYDYSNLYHRLAKGLGYNSQLITISVDEKVNHMINIISDETGYCILDQKRVIGCFNYKVLENDR